MDNETESAKAQLEQHLQAALADEPFKVSRFRGGLDIDRPYHAAQARSPYGYRLILDEEKRLFKLHPKWIQGEVGAKPFARDRDPDDPIGDLVTSVLTELNWHDGITMSSRIRKFGVSVAYLIAGVAILDLVNFLFGHH